MLFNILAISGSTMFAGVMLAIGITLGAYWKSLPPSDFLNWFSQNGQFIMRAVSLVVGPTLIGLAGSLWLSWGETGARLLWIGSAVAIAGVLALTRLWFVPANAQFAAKALPLDQVPARLDTWITIHNLRIGLAVVASIFGILAIRR